MNRINAILPLIMAFIISCPSEILPSLFLAPASVVEIGEEKAGEALTGSIDLAKVADLIDPANPKSTPLIRRTAVWDLIHAEDKKSAIAIIEDSLKSETKGETYECLLAKRDVLKEIGMRLKDKGGYYEEYRLAIRAFRIALNAVYVEKKDSEFHVFIGDQLNNIGNTCSVESKPEYKFCAYDAYMLAATIEDNGVRSDAAQGLVELTIYDNKEEKAMSIALAYGDGNVKIKALERIRLSYTKYIDLYRNVKISETIISCALVYNKKECTSLTIEAAKTLKQIGDYHTIHLLIDELNLDAQLSQPVIVVIEDILYELGKTDWLMGIEALKRASDSSESGLGVKAINFLGNKMYPSLFHFFASKINDKNENIRAAAARALGKLKNKEAVPLLKKALKSKDNSSRYMVQIIARALKINGTKEAYKVLAKPLRGVGIGLPGLRVSFDHKFWFLRYVHPQAFHPLGIDYYIILAETLGSIGVFETTDKELNLVIDTLLEASESRYAHLAKASLKSLGSIVFNLNEDTDKSNYDKIIFRLSKALGSSDYKIQEDTVHIVKENLKTIVPSIADQLRTITLDGSRSGELRLSALSIMKETEKFQPYDNEKNRNTIIKILKGYELEIVGVIDKAFDVAGKIAHPDFVEVLYSIQREAGDAALSEQAGTAISTILSSTIAGEKYDTAAALKIIANPALRGAFLATRKSL